MSERSRVRVPAGAAGDISSPGSTFCADSYGKKGVWRWGKRNIIYLLLHCHHQNDFCIKMGSDESRFTVSLIARDKVTRQCPQTTVSTNQSTNHNF